MTDTAVRQKPSSFPVSALIDETSSRDESISTSQEQERTSTSGTSQASDDDNSMDIEGETMCVDVNGESDDKNTEVGKTDSSVTNTGRQSRKRLPKLVATELQKIFEKNDTPSFDVREELGKKFGMTNREVQVWFQNKRAKLSRLAKLQSQQQLQQQSAGAAAQTNGPMLKSTKRWAPPPPIQIQTKNLSHRPIPILPSPTSSNTPLYVSSNSTKVQVAVPSYPVVPVLPAVSHLAKQDAGIASNHTKPSTRPVVPNIATHGKTATVAVPYYAYYPVYANHPGGVYMYPSYQNATPISPTYVYPTQPKSVVIGAASPKSPKSKSKSPSKLSISTDTATATSPKAKSTPSIPTPILPRPSYSWPMPMPIAGYPVYPSTWHRVMSAAMSTYGPMHQGAQPKTISTVPIAPAPNNSSNKVEEVSKNPKSISQTSTAPDEVTVQSNSSSKSPQKRTQPNNASSSSTTTQAREIHTKITDPASLSPSANSNPSPTSAVSDQVDIQDALLLVSLKHHQPQTHHPSYNPSSSSSNRPNSRSKTLYVAAGDHLSPQTKQNAKVTRKRGTQSIEDGNQSTVELNKKKRKTNEPTPKKPVTASSLSSLPDPTVEPTMTKTADKIKYAISHEHETLGTEQHKSPIVSHNTSSRRSGKERRSSRSSQSQDHGQTVHTGHGKSDKKGGKLAI